MSRILTVAAIGLAVAAAATLYQVKYEVRLLEQEARNLHRDVTRERQSIQVLEAEWAFLNQPSRIQDLADRYLDLKPLKPSQITTVERLPLRPVAPEPVPGTAPNAEGRPVDPLLAAAEGVAVARPPVMPTLKPSRPSVVAARPEAPRPAAPARPASSPAPVKPAPARPVPTRSAAAPAPIPVAATSDDLLDGVAGLFAAGNANDTGSSR